MPDPSDNARRLLQLLDRLRPQLLGPAFRRLSELQLSPSHLRLLRILQAAGPLAMKDLADQLALTPPSVTALTRRLVATGLVARRRHAADSRVVLLELTPAGRALHAQLTAEQLSQMGRLLAYLSPAEQGQFLDLLERAVQAGEQADGEHLAGSCG
ncbi:MAG: MarR family transcriptional regulator [Chloroflexi bacterium]|nr:MarR family transcriptional regulator [Chloroflexota bacterium]